MAVVSELPVSELPVSTAMARLAKMMAAFAALFVVAAPVSGQAILVGDLVAGGGSSTPAELTPLDGILYFCVRGWALLLLLVLLLSLTNAAF